MLVIGVVLALVAVLLIVVGGFTSPALYWLLWVGVGLIVVAVVLVIVDRTRGRAR